MAKPRTAVSRQLKRALKRETGDKCANPGCYHYRTHLHHIREWAVWETNDAAYMIALCPTCHDAVHNGALQITDEKIYRWKAIKRKPTNRDLIYVESGETHILKLGTLGFRGANSIAAPFQDSPTNALSYRIVGEDIFHVSLRISTRSGRRLMEIVDGHIRHEVEDPIRYERVPGRVRVTGPTMPDLMPDWAVDQMRFEHEPDYGEGGLTLLDLEVMEPGTVSVEGIWSYGDTIIVVTKGGLHLCNPRFSGGSSKRISNGVIEWHGPLDQSVLKFF